VSQIRDFLPLVSVSTESGNFSLLPINPDYVVAFVASPDPLWWQEMVPAASWCTIPEPRACLLPINPGPDPSPKILLSAHRNCVVNHVTSEC
jgi:hypothetical protein